MMDVAAMLVKDIASTPKDDYTNVERLASHGILTEGAAGTLTEPNGPRNSVVHEYEGLKDEIAITSAVDLVPRTRAAIREVRAWLSSTS